MTVKDYVKLLKFDADFSCRIIPLMADVEYLRKDPNVLYGINRHDCPNIVVSKYANCECFTTLIKVQERIVEITIERDDYIKIQKDFLQKEIDEYEKKIEKFKSFESENTM